MSKSIVLQIDKDYKLIKVLALDLKQRFPDTQGFSRTNLHSMKKFDESYDTLEIVQAFPGRLSGVPSMALWSWKSSTQPDGEEGLVNHKGI